MANEGKVCELEIWKRSYEESGCFDKICLTLCWALIGDNNEWDYCAGTR